MQINCLHLSWTLVLFCCLCGCRQASDPRIEMAARRFSGAALFWYHSASSEIGSELRKQFCRSNDNAPVSWRYVATACCPEVIDSPEKHFDAGWKSKENEPWFNDPGKARAYCIAREGEEPQPTQAFTKIMALHGAGTAFDAICRGADVDKLPPDTIILCEVRNSHVHWMEPGDLEIGSMPKKINPRGQLGISGNIEGGFFVGFADGCVWMIRDTVPFTDLSKFFTTDDAGRFEREEVLGPYAIRRIPPYGQSD